MARARRSRHPAVIRCSFRQGNIRCPYDGTGTPPLCGAHRMEIERASQPKPAARVLFDGLIDFLQGKPINREATLGAAEDFLSQWIGGLGADYRPDIGDNGSEDAVHRRNQAGRGPWNWSWGDAQGGAGAGGDGRARHTAPDPNAELAKARRAARVILGFRPTDQPTVEQIKVNHRLLVRKNHPDRGGSTKRMAAINAARDVLIEELAQA